VKLEIASNIPLEQKRNARKTRGLNLPDSDDDFLCMAMAARCGNQAGPIVAIRFIEKEWM
jgi:hypothetical protein